MPPATEESDSVELLADIVDEFAMIMDGADRTLWKYVHYRHNLLWVHAIASVLMASAFGATGKQGMSGPAFIILRNLPGSPVSLALLLGLGGFLLAIGLVFDTFPLKRLALIMLALFYTLVSASIAVPIFMWLFGGHVPKPPLYGPILYMHLTIIMVIHVWGTFKRPKR